MKTNKILSLILASALSLGLLTACGSSSDAKTDTSAAERIELTNVSYDPTRELYAAYNSLVLKHC